MDIATWMTAIFTAILTLITGVYAYLTYKLASYSKKAIQNSSDESILNRRPYLAFLDFNINHFEEPHNCEDIYRITIRLKNTGNSMMQYKLINSSIQSNQGESLKTNFKNSGSYIYPDLVEEFRLGSVKFLNQTPQLDEIVKFNISYKIEYLSIDNISYQTEREFELLFNRKSGMIEWFYLNSNDN